MNKYILKTNKNWLETRQQIAEEMRVWGISDWLVEKIPGEGARLTYLKNGKTIELIMTQQKTANDNLRVLFLAVQAIRKNELRGISDIVASAYIQIAGPVKKRDPYEVLGVYPDTQLEVIRAVYKAKALINHPDKGGKSATFNELKEAFDEIMEKHK